MKIKMITRTESSPTASGPKIESVVFDTLMLAQINMNILIRAGFRVLELTPGNLDILKLQSPDRNVTVWFSLCAESG